MLGENPKYCHRDLAEVQNFKKLFMDSKIDQKLEIIEISKRQASTAPRMPLERPTEPADAFK